MRKSSRLCPLNKSNPVDSENATSPRTDEISATPLTHGGTSSSQTKPVPMSLICAACGGEGHRRSSHYDCPRNRTK